MSRRPGPGNRWDTGSLAIYGALLGASVALLEQFCHAFCPPPWRRTPDGDLFTHVLLEVVVAAFLGASLFAAITAVRNRLMRDR